MGGGGGGAFIEFEKIINAAGECWRLRNLLEIKEKATSLNPDKYYAEPSLDSQNNTVKIRGNRRLGKNIRGSQKIIAEPGDLIIGTLHTNNGNGLFAISNDYYTCTSQLVAKIKDDVVPVEYLIRAMRKEFPRQLIPTDLVGRETFTKHQILDVLIPKPVPEDLTSLQKLSSEISRIQKEAEAKKAQIDFLLKQYSQDYEAPLNDTD